MKWHLHKWGRWSIYTNYAETKIAAQQSRTCSICGKVKIEWIGP